MIELANYKGREQAYVKHVFLATYLERLVHKTASKFSRVVYIDGFAGPWQSASERFEDTSFGIALGALRRAKASWKNFGREVQMSAHLVEQSPEAYAKLSRVPPLYPDIEVVTHRGDFSTLVPGILSRIPRDAFGFAFVDPKGWRLSMEALKPLLVRPNSEMIFNFMFEFINRAALMSDPAIRVGLDELIPFGDWRQKLEKIAESHSAAELRKEILVDAFASCLSHLGNYDYVAETTVLRPLRDRALYCLFYATRHPLGIEVFRDSQILALKEQASTRATAKIEHAEATTGQIELFDSLHDMAPDQLSVFLEQQRDEARAMVLGLVPTYPSTIQYQALWPKVLSRLVVRRTDMNKIVAQLRREGLVAIPDWERGKQIPQPSYRIGKVSSGF